MNKELGSRYATIREQQGFSHKQVEEFLDITSDKLIDFENGNARISVSDLEKSCDLFGCTIYMMIGQEEMCLLPKMSNVCNITVEDMAGLCAMNKIALNIRQMKSLCE